MAFESWRNLFGQAKLFCAVIFLQGCYAGLAMVAMFALNQGMSQYVFVVYRMAIASAIIVPFAILFDRKSRPKLTFSILAKTALLSLFDPVLDQNLYYVGMKYTTASFSSTMSNMLPAFLFLMAWIFWLEEVNIRRLHSQAKVLGTIVTVGGGMALTLVKGPVLNLPWTSKKRHRFQSGSAESQQDLIKGALMITASCFCWSCFVILQAYTLRSYPAGLSLTALICILGLLEGTVVALVLEWRSTRVWSIHLNTNFLAAFYGGILSGVGYYTMGVIIRERGPVFYSAFNPLSTIIVAILASIITDEKIPLGRVIGASIIIGGLYLILWEKSKDRGTSLTHTEVEATNDQDIDMQ